MRASDDGGAMRCGMRQMDSWGPSAMGAGRGTSWMSSLGQLMMFPLTAMMCGLDAIVGGAQCMGAGNITDPCGDPRLAALRKVFETSAGSSVGQGPLGHGNNVGVSAPGMSTAWSGSPPPGDSWRSTGTRSASDDDLSGDDLKDVSYQIGFTKPGYESLLQARREERIDYSTEAGNLAALKIAEFMERVARGAVARPQKWVDLHYPRGAVDAYLWQIPADDRRYIDFSYKVESRREKQSIDHSNEDLRLKRHFVEAVTDFLG